MKLIFNIESIKFPLTGVGRYAYELGRALERSGCFSDFVPWRSLSRAVRSLPSPSRADGYGSVKNAILEFPRLAGAFLNFRHRISALRLEKYKDYLYHGPNFYLPPRKGPNVVTIHDLSFISLPQFHPDYRLRIMDDAMKNVEKFAELIITVSEFSRKEIADMYGWPLARIKVTHEAASEDFRPRPGPEIAAGLSKYGLRPDGYSLFVGTVEPRKNIHILLDAYEGLPGRMRNRWPLVISGHHGWKSEKIHERIQTLSNAGWLRYVGFTPDDELPLLMSGAALFLYPSLYEGFGLPPLEAMQSGVPVIVSDRASLPEVVGDAAPILNAGDAALWTSWIERALEDEVWRTQAADGGLKQAASFSWDRCAAETISVYRCLLGSVRVS